MPKHHQPKGHSAFPFQKTALAAAVAMASEMMSLPALAEQSAAAEATAGIEEVIVTARKRSDNLQDVPLSVQAFSADRIEDLGIQRFEDFAVLSPSLAFVSWLPGTQMMFIRGIADGSNPNRINAATATMYLDEQPLTYAGGIADLHNYDIERIEVLNGPQGTYYGASATSGTVRIITNKPDADAFSAGADLTAGLIDGGDGIATAEGFVNIPLVDGVSAARLVGWYDQSTGFVDNVARTRTYRNGATASNDPFVKDDYNEERTFGFRGSLRSDLGERWQGTLSAFYQETETEGAWDHDPARVGHLEVARFGPEEGELSYGQVALTLEGSLGIGDLVYAGAYFDRDRQLISDYSDYVEYASFGSWIQQFACDDYYWYGNLGCNDPSMYYYGDYASERWSHEVRFSSTGEGRFNWIVGAYYEKNESDNSTYWDMPGIRHEGVPGAYYIANNGGSPLPDEWWSVAWDSEWEQLAGFGEVSYAFTDQLSATFGLRAFDSKFSADTAWAGYFYDAKTPSSGSGSTDDLIYKFNLTYAVNDDWLTYFTYAEGFRPGGRNAEGATNPNVPEIYEPDVLDSYEVGWKATLGGGRATFNGAAYYMEWQDFQTSIYDLLISPLIFRANAGSAEVKGIETDLQVALTPNLTVQVAATYNDSVLAEDFNSTVDSTVVWAEKGRELPYVPKWKFAANARYEWTQTQSVTGYAQVTYSYTDKSWNLLITEPFQAEAVPKRQAAYDLMDLRVGWEFAGGRYGVELFGANLFDEQAEIFINTGNYDERITTNRPRTWGVRLKTRFN